MEAVTGLKTGGLETRMSFDSNIIFEFYDYSMVVMFFLNQKKSIVPLQY